MLAVLGCLFGIFVGLTTSWYFQIKPISENINKISQLENENDDLRHEKDDLQEDLSIANKEIEMKDKIVERIKVIINDFMTKEDKLNRIKELADDYQSIN